MGAVEVNVADYAFCWYCYSNSVDRRSVAVVIVKSDRIIALFEGDLCVSACNA